MNKKNRSLRGALTLSAGLACAAWSAPAAAEGLLEDKWMISIGTFLVGTDTEIAVDGTGGRAGTVIDLQKDLGIDDQDRLRVDATWRFAKRHRARLLWFNTDDSGSRTIDRQITIGDTTYPLNARLDAGLETTITELAYEYSFLQRDNYELAGSFGLHAVKFDFSVSGTGSVGGVTGSARRETAVAEAPLPVIGLRGLWEFAPKWYLDGQLQFFAISFEEFDGSLTDFRVGVTRMFGKHWGVGAGYNQFVTDVDVTKDRFTGSLDWKYAGLQIYLTASF